MSFSIRLLVLSSLAFACQNLALSQVVINEFSCSNYSMNIAGDNEDYIELYNPTTTDVDIGGWFLSDNPLNVQKFEIPAATIVPAGGYFLVICSGEGALITNLYQGGYLNTNFKVSQCTGESIIFSDPFGNIIDNFAYLTDVSTTQANHSWSREVDGSSIWRVCSSPTPNAANGAGMYASYAPTPIIETESGYYSGGFNLSISSPPGYDIYYTINGYSPDATSSLYTGPISINATTVIRAVAVDPSSNEAPSFISTNTFFIGTDSHSICVVSVSGDGLEDGYWPESWEAGAIEPMHIEFFNPDGTFRVEATGDSNEHGNDSNGYDQRGFDYITRDQMGYDKHIEAQLFSEKQRTKFQRLIFKAAANDNYSFAMGAHVRDAYVHTLSHKAELHLDERTNESCVLYINGEYWGVYEYREKVDDLDFTRKYYNQPRHFVDFMKTWGGTWAEYGSGNDWYDLVSFVTGQDMTLAGNYDYVESQLNTMSLIDYFILNSYVVCVDWLNWNTAWWRGRHPEGQAKKWRYVLWDMDATFGHYVNYTGMPDTSSDADPCNPEGIGNVGGQGHVPVLNALMGNETFFASYVNRWADLGNTYFTCDYMHSVLDSMVMVIEPEMPRQCLRWGGDMAGWQAELQQLRDFIDSRCENSLLTGLESCYNVTPVTLNLIIDGDGSVQLNTVQITPELSPFSGWYFEELPITLTGEPGVGVDFLYWEITEGFADIADPTMLNVSLDLTGDLTIIAHFGQPSPPEDITFNIEPVNAGTIILDSTPIDTYPSTESLLVSGHTIQAVPKDEWWTFSHWTSDPVGNIVSPDLLSPDANLDVNSIGTLTAHFNFIDHTNLEVGIEPYGAGFVRVVDVADVYDYFSTEMISEAPLRLESFPNENWEFDYWMVETTDALPDSTSTEIVLNLSGVLNERVIAVFKGIDFQIFIPNAFTPDNDGVNDTFLPLGQGFSSDNYSFTIVNRWGEKVFYSEDPTVPWLGNSNIGAGDYFVPVGVYMYTVIAKDAQTLYPTIIRGYVSIVR